MPRLNAEMFSAEVLEGLRTRDSANAKGALQVDIAWGELMIDGLEKKENLAEA